MASLRQTLARWPTALVWGLVGFSSVAWWLQVRTTHAANTLAPPAAMAATSPPDTGAIARLLGAGARSNTVAAAVAPPASSRFVIVGIAASGANSVALIAVDGKPAKPFVVGAEATSGWVIKSISGRRVELGTSLQAPVSLTLELPAKTN